ncbi:MAG: 2-oxoglutarate dehydrogenase complex dihydrolipoyllysine-residue succinyltransferase [bacterium]|nr:2-oxoglutarate dehydrogenase complex dihydrolipoyllysine-residue succinyltransferase [bacterium]
MRLDVEVPELGESITEAILVEWLKADGDAVGLDESICVIETDKADVELPSPAAGVLRTLKSNGDTIQVGEAIAQIEEGEGAPPVKEKPAEEVFAPTPEPVAEAPESVDADGLSPAVRRLVSEHGLDPNAIPGTGKDGRLTKEDVLGYLESQAEPAPEPAPAPVLTPPAPSAGFDADGTRREPMSRIRQRIAQNLIQAQHTAAMLTTFNEVDMSGIFAIRTKYKEQFQETHGISLGLMSFFVRASVLALKDFPDVNASIDGTDVVYHDYVHMAIAVSTERGLVVPVLKHIDQMSFANIESKIKRVALSARDGKLRLDELSGGTFTITNGGVFGSMLSTPILNPPQAGILGMHNISNRPVAIGDEVGLRPMMYLALTYDHRLVDGKDSVSFLVRLKELLEDPARMMLEV